MYFSAASEEISKASPYFPKLVIADGVISPIFLMTLFNSSCSVLVNEVFFLILYIAQ